MVDFDVYDEIIIKAKQIAISKNKLYGDDSLKSFKGIALLARSNDKLKRIENMLLGSKDINKEFINDNLLDIINYIIYYYMYINERL